MGCSLVSDRCARPISRQPRTGCSAASWPVPGASSVPGWVQ